jgi:hypothetical protein
MQVVMLCVPYLACVEKVAHIYAEVSLKPYYITTCTMHYLFVTRAMRNYNFRHIVKYKRTEREHTIPFSWLDL